MWRRDPLPYIALVVILALPVVVFAVQVSVWNECRAGGYSFFYCLSLVTR